MNLRFRSPFFHGFLLVLTFAFFATGCKKDTNSTTDQPADPSTLDWRRTENTVYVNMPAEPRGLNPLLTTQGYARYVHEQIIQSLLEIDPETFDQVPLLASAPSIFERPDGGVDYTYDLMEDAKWPNGLPVTATDVVFTLKVLFNPAITAAGPYRSFYSAIENITLIPANEKRFKVQTREPYILSEAAINSLPVYPEYAYDPEGLLSNIRLQDLLNPAKAEALLNANENLTKFAEQFTDPAYARDPEKVVGSGPYQLESWEEGQRIRLVRRDNYWAQDADKSWLTARPEAIVFQFVSDGAVAANALRDQEFDAVMEMDVENFTTLRDEKATSQYYNFHTTPSFKHYALLLNQDDPLLREKETRRALAHLVDLESFIENFYGGLAIRLNGPILPIKPYYRDDLALIPYDPAKAAEILTSAGWSDSNGNGTLDKEIDGEVQELELELIYFDTGISQDIALMMQAGAQEAGVEINIQPTKPGALYQRAGAGDYQIATMGAGTDPNPDDLKQAFHSSSVPPAGTNRARFRSAEADRLIDQIRVTFDDEKRAEYYRQLQEIIYEEQPMIFLFSPEERIIISKRFAGVPSSIAPGFEVNDFEQKAWNKVD